MFSQIRVQSVAKTDFGKVKKTNEDYICQAPEVGLFIVCDGVSGHQAGDVAGKMAAQTVVQFIKDRINKRRPSTLKEAEQALREAITHASSVVFEKASSDPSLQGMSTTLDAVWVVGGFAVLGHVGDGRIYQRRGGDFHRLTEDHTYETEFVKSGSMSPEEARKSPYRNVLTRAVGISPFVQVDILKIELMAKDRLLLCSDGLTRYLKDEEIMPALDHKAPLAGQPENFITLANQRGGKDNISVMVLAVEGAKERDTGSIVIPEAEQMPTPQLKIETLKKIAFFAHLTYTDMNKLLAIGQLTELKGGQVMMTQGEPADELWVVLTGSVDIIKNNQHITTVKSGVCFGEMALLGEQKRTATVRAASELKALVFSRSEFMSLLDSDPGLGYRVLHTVTRLLMTKLEEVNDKFARQQNGELVL